MPLSKVTYNPNNYKERHFEQLRFTSIAQEPNSGKWVVVEHESVTV